MSDEPEIKVVPKYEKDSNNWNNPYLIYIVATLILFGVLMLAGWLAMKNDWLPKH